MFTIIILRRRRHLGFQAVRPRRPAVPAVLLDHRHRRVEHTRRRPLAERSVDNSGCMDVCFVY